MLNRVSSSLDAVLIDVSYSIMYKLKSTSLNINNSVMTLGVKCTMHNQQIDFTMKFVKKHTYLKFDENWPRNQCFQFALKIREKN